jgi:hypothetical protein
MTRLHFVFVQSVFVFVGQTLAAALVMRQGGIIAEDADYDEAYEASATAAAKKASGSD